MFSDGSVTPFGEWDFPFLPFCRMTFPRIQETHGMKVLPEHLFVPSESRSMAARA
jgi:hypothetical protein